MATQILPDLTIPDDLDPKTAGLLRLIYQRVGQAFAFQERKLTDARTNTDERVAHSLRAMEGNVSLDKARMGADGDVLYLIDGGRNAVWGSGVTPAPTSGGVAPVGGANVLLDGVVHTDTVGQSVTRGSLIKGNATPKWDELVIGAADTFLKADGTDAAWQPALGKTGAAKVDLITQSGAIGVTNLIAAPTAGVYLVSYDLIVTFADVTAGAIQMSIGSTDTLGANTQVGAGLVLTATGRDRGTFVCQVASGALTYQIIVAGAVNAARFAVYIRTVFLG